MNIQIKKKNLKIQLKKIYLIKKIYQYLLIYYNDYLNLIVDDNQSNLIN